MRGSLGISLGVVLWMSVSLVAGAEDSGQSKAGGSVLPEDYSCKVCHWKDGDLWSEETPTATEADLANDIHWQKGLRCHDCHGGQPKIEDYVDHRTDESFHAIGSPADIPGFCGRCHSNIEYMRRYAPSARTDQESEYWTSGHGRRLKASTEGENPQADETIATCVSCHGKHGVLSVKDARSPVYPTHVAETCSQCHSDEQKMADRTYGDRPMGHDQFELWQQSVHGKALLENGDLSAPTCNDCHGNHGAMPPGVDSVANACGTCHGKVANLFAGTRMKHKFEEEGLPGCATCHSNHKIVHPTDQFLGMGAGAFCAKCHDSGKSEYGATIAGAEIAKTLRDGLEDLKQQIAEAEDTIHQADRLGMEVRGPRFDLRQAGDELTNARSLIHGFSPKPVQEALKRGSAVATDVRQRAEDKLKEHTYRRVWLAGSLVPILLVIGLLIVYIRTMPVPGVKSSDSPWKSDVADI